MVEEHSEYLLGFFWAKLTSIRTWYVTAKALREINVTHNRHAQGSSVVSSKITRSNTVENVGLLGISNGIHTWTFIVIQHFIQRTSCTSRWVASRTSSDCWRQSGASRVTNVFASGLSGTGFNRTNSGLSPLQKILCPRPDGFRWGVAVGSSGGKVRQKFSR